MSAERIATVAPVAEEAATGRGADIFDVKRLPRAISMSVQVRKRLTTAPDRSKR